MREYLTTVDDVLETGTYKPNRTAVDTIAGFSKHYTIDLNEGYPLLTTKQMDGFRWDSMLYEVMWYLSGQEHVRELSEHTQIWDAWADDDGNLDTAYGRFWRRFPVPSEDDQLPGESWADEDNRWVNVEETEDGKERLTFDQIQCVIDTLNGDNPDKSPHSRRMVINAWHPANANVSTLPPCHYTFVFNVKGNELNLHLTQRSADLALGVPFNIACYSLLLKAVAQQTDFEPGTFSHTLVDAHVYCGTDERGEWYGDNIEELQRRVAAADDRTDYQDIKAWIEANAPPAETDPRGKPYDHVPGLLEQLSREPNDRPELHIADKDLDDLEFDDIEVTDYNSHPGIDFGVAE